jgi:L-threonylcarbamoyladenylate synthase
VQSSLPSSAAAVEIAATELLAGGIVAIPTETVYGLAVTPSPEGLARLVEAKRRSADKGVALLVDSIEQVRLLASVPPVAELLAQRFWPGALTLVLPQRPDVPLPSCSPVVGRP